MLTHHSLTQLKALRLDGMARALEEQLALPSAATLSFEERIAFIIDREIAFRDSKRLTRLLKQAKLRVGSACLEDVDYRPGRGIEKKLVASLASGDWIRYTVRVAVIAVVLWIAAHLLGAFVVPGSPA